MNEGINKGLNPQEENKEVKLESDVEHILSRKEIMEILATYTEVVGVVTRELFDEQKIVYLLEVTIEGPQEGETTEFTYRRAGTYPNKVRSPETLIEAAYYQDGFPVSADTLATYDPKARTWKHNPIEEINIINKKVRDELGREAFDALAQNGREGVLAVYKSICEREKHD